MVLDVLGLKEAVALLAAVAQLDADQLPPVCVEIAQGCGRLPLCLNVRSISFWRVAEAGLFRVSNRSSAI